MIPKDLEEKLGLKRKIPVGPKYKVKIAVVSGKGGVGKSTIATGLAVTLHRRGYKVALMDADVYGPNVPTLLGLSGTPEVKNNKIIPLETNGMKVLSVSFFIDQSDTPLLWRGPLVHKLLEDFVEKVDWGEGDFLIIDTPPGTGDPHLSLTKLLDLTGAIIVTTPQTLALEDVSKTINAYKRFGVDILGLVVNASYVICPKCGEKIPLSDESSIEYFSQKYGLPILTELPLMRELTVMGGKGMFANLPDELLKLFETLGDVGEGVLREVLAQESEETPSS